VIARSSSFSYGPDVDPRAACRELGAKYLLEGRVRRSGDGYRLSAALTDAQRGNVLWSPRLELPCDCPPEALEPLVADIVAVLDTRIDSAEQVRALAKPPTQLNVNELIWRGRWHLNRFTRADAEIARNLFEEALAKSPNSPEALIQATYSLAWSIWAERGSDAEIAAMRKLAQLAIQADYDDGRGHMLAGIAEMWLHRPTRARALLQRAISLNPSLAMAHAQLGGCHNLIGRPEAAIDCLRAAMRLSPNDTHLFYMLGELATACCMLGRWAEAVEHADQAIMRRPAYWYSHMIKVTALARSGDLAEAASAFDDLLAAKPKFDPDYISWLPFVDRTWPDYFRESLAMAASVADPAAPWPREPARSEASASPPV
jgi:tetratricopeptide (TPR) repeat protein